MRKPDDPWGRSPDLLREHEAPHDWNVWPSHTVRPTRAFALHDETLRDGIQNPSIEDPTLEEKIEMLHLLDRIGVGSVNVGLPGAGPRAFADTLRLCEEIARAKLSLHACAAARTLVGDIAPCVEVVQRTGVPIEVMAFIGSSPIRQSVENWSLDFVREKSVEAIAFSVKEGLSITYVTEDTARSRPEVLEDLFRAAIDHGAGRLCLCDTVGHATPDGAASLVTFTRHVIASTGVEVGIDWHGHDDRGHSLPNALSAWEAGADRIHGCVLGVGERVGNTPLELLLFNLDRLGVLDERYDLGPVPELCRLVSEATGFPLPPRHEKLTG